MEDKEAKGAYLTFVFGALLLAYMIMVEDEPGLVAVIIIVLGSVRYLITGKRMP